MLSERKGKDLSPKFTSLTLEIVEDQLGAIWHVYIYCHEQKIWVQRFKHTTQKLPDMLSLSPRLCQCMRQFFVKRPKFLAATSNVRVEQHLVHLGRFLHFSQEVALAFSHGGRGGAPWGSLPLPEIWSENNRITIEICIAIDSPPEKNSQGKPGLEWPLWLLKLSPFIAAKG